MSDFAIPRVAIPAQLLLTAGERRDGHIYVMERVPQHAGPETPLDMLNRADGFFPFRTADDGGAVLLVTKARTITLSVARDEAGEDPARRSAAKMAGIELTLADGSHLSGRATLELPVHHSRLLDYLNATTDPFFAVATADRVHFVNRAHVLYARPED
ncbi:MAG: hypothetical protein ACREME_03555 [Gemmatimonadales bacterium]